MTDLSPEAQATWEAYEHGEVECDPYFVDPRASGLAAALRAAADQVVPELGRPRTQIERTLYHEGRLDAAIRHRAHLRSIADELDPESPTP